jgi:hypothetical protein
MRLQAEPDQTCLDWLASEEGQNFTNCESGNPGAPIPNNDNNCVVTTDEMDSYCEDACFDILMNGYNFIIQTGTCLPVYEDKFKPCLNNTDCPDLGTGPRVCSEGFCYMACNTTDDCNSCLMETCETMGQFQGCQGNITEPLQGAGLANRTIQNTFRGMVYSLNAACIKNTQGDYCALMQLNTNATCDSLSAQWGCCVGTMLPSLEYCQWQKFTDPNLAGLFQCNISQACQPLPLAQQFCQVTSNGTASNSSSSSGISSSSGSTGSTGMSSTGMSSSGSFSSHTGSSGVGGTGNNGTDGSAAGRLTISWTVTLALALVAHVVS